MSKPTVAVDFDGVLHRYDSGWQGVGRIPSPPTEGALQWLLALMDEAEVVILSSRANAWRGRRAIRRWLIDHLEALLHLHSRHGELFQLPGFAIDAVVEAERNDKGSAEAAARMIVRDLKVTARKPGCVAVLDDRAVRFDGTFPAVEALTGFKPWNRT